LLFAKNNLIDEEFRLFQRLFEVLNTTFPKPDIIVYLHRSVEDVMRNIKKRGRNFETDISAEYLLGIQNVYFEYFRTETDLPILIIDVEGIDYLTDQTAYQKLVGFLNQKYEKGIHRLAVS
jgi:deoxyadenosine/deoxycytidine kinase